MTILDFVLIAAGAGAMMALLLLALVGGVLVAGAAISLVAMVLGYILETISDWLDKRKDPAN
jgi:hypothetical protein